jgi:integrase
MPAKSSHGSSHKRRRGPKHPGVVLIPPTGKRVAHRARYEDPDTGRTTWESLPLNLTTIELRDAWAVNKSRALAKRRQELEAGAPRATGVPLSEAIDRYFKAHPSLRANTLTAYRAAERRFLAWASRSGLQSADDLNRARLMQFRTELLTAPKHAAARGGKRGAVQPKEELRSAHSVNRDLRSIRTILGYLCDADTFARLTHDDLRRALKRQAAALERIDYLKPQDLRRLIDAALAHDAATFAATREEHAGKGQPGSTRRYEAIAPYLVTTLLTGMRAGACLALQWQHVQLEPEPGEIVPPGGSLTKRTGVIGLEVSPALRELLVALQPDPAQGRVFPELTASVLKAAHKRLLRDFKAPASTWQTLRVTCGSYLTNAPGIFGAASAYRSAKQLGHSVAVAEKHYVGLVRGIPPTATTIEAAMQIEAEVAKVTEAAKGTARSRHEGSKRGPSPRRRAERS